MTLRRLSDARDARGQTCMSAYDAARDAAYDAAHDAARDASVVNRAPLFQRRRSSAKFRTAQLNAVKRAAVERAAI